MPKLEMPEPETTEPNVNPGAESMNRDINDANRRAAWRWGGMVVSLLGLQVIGGIWAIVLATGDPSVAVVPDYHQKALDWDKEVALQSASRSLGWIYDASPMDAKSDAAGADAGLRIRLTDGDGKPIDLVSGELEIYRHARAADVRRVRIPTGVFHALELDNCFDADGLWQVTINVNDRSGNRFTQSSELDVTRNDTSRAR